MAERIHANHLPSRRSPVGSVLSRLLPIAACIAGLALTIAAAGWERQRIAHSDHQRFNVLQERLRGELLRRLAVYRQALIGVRSAFIASKHVEHGEFYDLVSARNIRVELPGALGIGYINRVHRDRLDDFITHARDAGRHSFSIATSGDHPNLYVVEYFEPETADTETIGYDVWQDPVSREAADRAMVTGDASLTGIITLTRGRDTGPSFLYLLPVYQHGADLSSVEGRQIYLAGWVYMPLIAERIFHGAAHITEGELSFEVYDNAAGGPSLIYDDTPDDAPFVSAARGAHSTSAAYETTARMEIGGQTWTVFTRPSHLFKGQDRYGVTKISVGGAALSLLLGLLLQAQATAARRARALADSLTVDLRRLAMVAERTTNAVIITDVRRRIVWVNEGFTRITGYTFDEAIGRSPAFLQCQNTCRATRQRIRDALQAQQGFSGEILNRGKNGQEYWLQLDIQPVRDDNGMLSGFMAIEADITERKNLEIKIAQDAARLADANTALEDAQLVGRVGSWTYDLSTGEVTWTRQLYRLFGRDEAAGPPDYASVLEDYCDEDAARLDAAVRECIAHGTPYTLTMRTRHGLGGVRFVRGEGRARRNADGATIALFGTAMDVTGEVEHAEALRSAQEQMRFALEGAGDGVWDWDLAAGRVEFSKRWKEMLGYAESEVGDTPTDWSDRVHIHDLAGALAGLNAHLEGRTASYISEHRMRCKDGSWKWILARGMVVRRDAQGQPLRIVGTHTDVTERRRAEEALRETTGQLNLYHKIIDQHAIIAETDRRGMITNVNEAFCRISGYSREELLGQNHRILNSGIHPTSMWAEMYRIVSRGGFWHGEICNRAKDGRLYWVDTTIAPLRDADGRLRGYFALRADITALKRAQQLAEDASRSKSEFLANMSHEIRTPMTAILGFADLLADERTAAAPELRREHIATIRRNGEHLLAILNDILDISKIEAGKMAIDPVPVSPVAALAEVLCLMDVKARTKGISLTAEAVTDLPTSVRTDPVRLRQILMNLIGNAVKFTQSGSVTVRISRPAADIHRLRFDIEDTGIGLTDAQRERLFGAFVQADSSTTRQFGGTGLGLRISKRLAEMLGGDITVESAYGKGSVFTLTIDAAADHDAGITPAGPVSPAGAKNASHELLVAAGAPLAGMHLLLAEDGPDNQRLIGHHLRRAGADVSIVSNGKQAVDAVASAAFDLIVMDMQMPEMDGYTAAWTIRARGCDTPIIALTAHAMSGDRERCLEAGCNDYQTKPINPRELINACLHAARRQAA